MTKQGGYTFSLLGTFLIRTGREKKKSCLLLLWGPKYVMHVFIIPTQIVITLVPHHQKLNYTIVDVCVYDTCSLLWTVR